MDIKNIHKNIKLVQKSKPFMANYDISEYDYYVKIPKNTINIIECNLIVKKVNKYTANLEA